MVTIAGSGTRASRDAFERHGVLAGGTADVDVDRAAPDAADQVARAVRHQAGRWVVAADSPLLECWRGLAAVGRADLAVGRLLEGHVDALRILREAGRGPVGDAVYGVWASASGATGLVAAPDEDGWRVSGTMRYCSGAWFVDRALVVVSTAEQGQTTLADRLLVDVDVRGAQAAGVMTRRDDTWPAVGMDVTRSVDVDVRSLRVGRSDVVGPPGFYLDRPGFAAGGVGVAAVWLAGAAGVLDALVDGLTMIHGKHPGPPGSAHQRAHLGAMAVEVVAADAVLTEVALGGRPTADEAAGARSTVELAVETVLRRAPRLTGPTPLCRDAALAHRLADLAVYVRQHHAEADYERIGDHVLDSRELIGRRFGGSAWR